MPRFKVHLFQSYNRFATVEVEAEDEIHAEELALELEQTKAVTWESEELEDGGVDWVEEVTEDD